MPRPTDPMTQRSIRLPEKIWTRVRVHAEALSLASGGAFTFTDSDAIRDVLVKHLPPDPADVSTASAEKPAKAKAAKGTPKRKA